ncbi:MAG: sulfite exporter TauE/SafE family protein [Planctomycetota bacterium]|nr:sulfite exporter TauE/SafE family protein [Planctomycetota bacterium]
MTVDWMAIWWGLVLLGFLAGVLSGALGVGGGIVVVPALVFFFGAQQKSAQGMALAVMVPMALLGAWQYWRNPEIGFSLGAVGILVIGAIAGTLLGTEVAARLPAEVLRKAFAVFLLVVAIKMLISPGAPAAPAAPLPGDGPAPASSAPIEKGTFSDGR